MFQHWRWAKTKTHKCRGSWANFGYQPDRRAQLLTKLEALQGKSGAQLQPTIPGYGLGSIVGGLAKAMLVALKRDLPLAAPPLDKFSNIKECPNGTWQCLLGNFVGPRRFLKNKPSALKILSEQPWLHEFSIQEPKAIPDVWGRRGSFALLGTLFNFVLKPSVSLASEMEAQRRKIGLDRVNPEDVISMHIRHGDACNTTHTHHLKYRKCLPLSAYMVHAEKIRRNEGKRVIYLSTDSRTIIEDTKRFPSWSFVFQLRPRRADSDSIYWDDALAEGKLDAYNEAKWAIFD